MLGLLAMTAAAEIRWTLELDVLEGEWLGTGPVRVELTTRADGTLQATLDVKGLSLPAPLAQIERVVIDCARLGRDPDGGLSCRDGRLGPAPSGPAGTLSWRRTADGLAVNAKAVPYAGGRVDLEVRPVGERGTRLELRAEGLRAEALFAAGGAGAPVEFTGGVVRLHVSARANANGESVVDLEAAIEDLDYASEDGSQGAERLSVTVEGRFRTNEAESRGWRIDGTVRLERGGVLAGGIFLDADAAPLALDLDARWLPARRRVEVRELAWRQPGVLGATAAGTVQYGERVEVLDLTLAVPETALEPVYRHYLEGLLAGTLGDRLETSGRAGLRVAWRRGEGEARLTLAGVRVLDPRGRFSVAGLDGALAWNAEPQGAAVSEIRWEGASVLGAVLGDGSLAGSLIGRRFVLARAAQVPFLDGSLRVTELEIEGLGTDAPSFGIGGSLDAVSMESVSEAFGWPSLPGRIAGDFPPVRFAEGRLRVGGEIRIEAFEGWIAIRELVLERPLGVLPRLRAEVDIANVSLEALTSAFSFGRILGRLDGRIRGLELVDWRPVAFDASFATPADAAQPRRISQRAVDNLAALGGGPSALLSSTFLRVFEEFSYERLGIRCRLRNGTCEMGGIGNAAGGYVIVEGAGLPRITVRGFNRRVDWGVLVDRLRAAMASEGPTIR